MSRMWHKVSFLIYLDSEFSFFLDLLPTKAKEPVCPTNYPYLGPSSNFE